MDPEPGCAAGLILEQVPAVGREDSQLAMYKASDFMPSLETVYTDAIFKERDPYFGNQVIWSDFATASTSHRSTRSNGSPGRSPHRSSGRCPSSCGMSQCRLASMTTGPLIPKCVQSKLPVRRSTGLPPTTVDSSTSCEMPEQSA